MIGIVLSVAVAAILMRQKPQDLAINPPPAARRKRAQAPAKIAQRAQPSPATDAAAAPPSAPAAGEAHAGQLAADAAAGPQPRRPGPRRRPAEAQLPSAARAAMLIASADNPQKPVVNLGSTVWSTRPRPAGTAGRRRASRPTPTSPTSRCTPR